MEKKKQSDKQPKKEGKSKTKCNLLEYLRNMQDYSYPKSYQIDNLIKKFDNVVEKFDEIVKKGRKWNIIMLILTFILTFLTIGILFLGFQQLKLIKEYQDWSVEQMSRKPYLFLHVRKTEILADNNGMRIWMTLINSGDDIAKYVQIRMAVTDTMNTSKKPKYMIDVTGPEIVRYKQNGESAVKLPLYQFQDIVYITDEAAKGYGVHVPWHIEVSKLPSTLPNLHIGYMVDCDKYSRFDSLVIDNPFYDKNDG